MGDLIQFPKRSTAKQQYKALILRESELLAELTLLRCQRDMLLTLIKGDDHENHPLDAG